MLLARVLMRISIILSTCQQLLAHRLPRMPSGRAAICMRWPLCWCYAFLLWPADLVEVQETNLNQLRTYMFSILPGAAAGGTLQPVLERLDCEIVLYANSILTAGAMSATERPIGPSVESWWA